MPRTTVSVRAPSFSATRYTLYGWNCTPASLSWMLIVAIFAAPKVPAGAFVRENYFCCDGKESHWWDTTFFVGLPTWHLVQDVQICRDSVPSETEGCPDFTGDFPEGVEPARDG